MAKTYDELLDLIEEATLVSLRGDCRGLMTEGVLSNPLKKYLEKLESIKKQKPSEYSGPNEVKKFVDENFDDIEKAASLLEKEPEELKKNEIKLVIGVIGSYVAFFISVGISEFVPVVGVVGVIASLGALAMSLFIGIILSYIRRTDDIQAMNELSKIKTSLIKIEKTNLPGPVKKKISAIITKISDAEIEVNLKAKVIKESQSVIDEDLDVKLAIYESAYAGEITAEERDTLLSVYDTTDEQN